MTALFLNYCFFKDNGQGVGSEGDLRFASVLIQIMFYFPRALYSEDFENFRESTGEQGANSESQNQSVSKAETAAPFSLLLKREL